MIKRFTPHQLFSLTDGRMSTTIDDIYDMLNHICDTNLMTHHLPVAYNYLKIKNPKWFSDAQSRLRFISNFEFSTAHPRDVDFENMMETIQRSYNEPIEVPQLKDEFDTSDFGNYMVENSLLK